MIPYRDHTAARFEEATRRIGRLLSSWGFSFVLGEILSSHCGPYATGAFIRRQTKISLSCRDAIDNLIYEHTFTTEHPGYIEIDRYSIGHAVLMDAVGHLDDCHLISGHDYPDQIVARDGGDRVAALVHDLENYAAHLLRTTNEEFYSVVRRGFRSYSIAWQTGLATIVGTVDLSECLTRSSIRRTIRCTGAAKSGGFTMNNQSSPPRDRWRWVSREHR